MLVCDNIMKQIMKKADEEKIKRELFGCCHNKKGACDCFHCMEDFVVIRQAVIYNPPKNCKDKAHMAVHFACHQHWTKANYGTLQSQVRHPLHACTETRIKLLFQSDPFVGCAKCDKSNIWDIHNATNKHKENVKDRT